MAKNDVKKESVEISDTTLENNDSAENSSTKNVGEDKVENNDSSENSATKKVAEDKVEKGQEEEMVQVSKRDLQALMKKLDDQAEDIKVLYGVSDKNRLQRFDNSEREAALIKTVRAWFYDGKLVVATKLITNQSDVINGKAFEDQKLLAIFEDGDSKEMRYRDFEVHKTFEKAEIIGSRTESGQRAEDAETFLKLQFGNGRKVEISAKFIN
jgi:hypothetical protein